MAHCISSMCKNPHLQYVASFPGSVPFWLHKERRGPGMFPHVCDVKGRRWYSMWANWGSEQQGEL